MFILFHGYMLAFVHMYVHNDEFRFNDMLTYSGHFCLYGIKINLKENPNKKKNILENTEPFKLNSGEKGMKID